MIYWNQKNLLRNQTLSKLSQFFKESKFGNIIKTWCDFCENQLATSVAGLTLNYRAKIIVFAHHFFPFSFMISVRLDMQAKSSKSIVLQSPRSGILRFGKAVSLVLVNKSIKQLSIHVQSRALAELNELNWINAIPPGGNEIKRSFCFQIYDLKCKLYFHFNVTRRCLSLKTEFPRRFKSPNIKTP